IGIISGDTVHLNPDHVRVIEAGDRLIHIAADDRSVRLGTPVIPDVAAISDIADTSPRAERTLVLGHNSDLPMMLQELSEYVPTGSSVTIVADMESPGFRSFENLAVHFVRGDTTSRAVLNG